MPARYTPEWYAFGLLDQILGQGRDSRFYDELVRKRGLTGEVSAGINWGLGSMYDYNGPMLWEVTAFHDTDKPADSLSPRSTRPSSAPDTAAVDRRTLARAVTKLRSSLYSKMEQFSGSGAPTCSPRSPCSTTIRGRINRLEAEFAKVTPELVLETART